MDLETLSTMLGQDVKAMSTDELLQVILTVRMNRRARATSTAGVAKAKKAKPTKAVPASTNEAIAIFKSLGIEIPSKDN